MPISDNLISAYRWHRLNGTLARSYARVALKLARADVAAGCNRYPETEIYPAVSWQDGTRIGHVSAPERAGLRHIGNVEAESYGGRDCWSRRESCGWFTDPYGDVLRDGTGLCWGVVYQLPARSGKARFVAGYQFGGVDGGPTLDFGTIYEGEGGDSYWNHDDVLENDAARDAARAADDMARKAAEEERDYQTAYAAGSRWAEKREERDAAGAEAKEARAELKRLRDMGEGRSLAAGAVRESIKRASEARAEAVEEMIQLAAGDSEPLYFYTGDDKLRAAFNEGAGRKVI